MLHIFQVYFEDRLAAFEIRQFHDDTTVETAWAEQSLIQTLRTVRGSEDDDTFRGIEAIHLGEQLVQRLLTLIVAHCLVTTLTNGVNLINEDDTRCFLGSLTEEVADFRGTHADEHLYKLGAADREKRNMRLSGYGTRYQRLTGARRTDEQGTLRQPGS